MEETGEESGEETKRKSTALSVLLPDSHTRSDLIWKPYQRKISSLRCREVLHASTAGVASEPSPMRLMWVQFQLMLVLYPAVCGKFYHQINKYIFKLMLNERHKGFIGMNTPWVIRALDQTDSSILYAQPNLITYKNSIPITNWNNI